MSLTITKKVLWFFLIVAIFILTWILRKKGFVWEVPEKISYQKPINWQNDSPNSYIYLEETLHQTYKDAAKLSKIIHQSWKTRDVPEVFRKYVTTWKKCFPEWQFMFWTDEDNRDLIANHYPWFLTKYDGFPAPIYKADCARYIYMLHYGGIYTDLDNECLNPFEHLLANHSIVFGDIDFVPRIPFLKENYIQNSFIYSQPNHSFWMELLITILNSKINGTADVITGPMVLSNTIHTYRMKYPTSHNIKVYEGRYFNPMTWGEQRKNPKYCKIYNRMTEIEYEQCRNYYKRQGSYVIQFHSHVWG